MTFIKRFFAAIMPDCHTHYVATIRGVSSSVGTVTRRMQMKNTKIVAKMSIVTSLLLAAGCTSMSPLPDSNRCTMNLAIKEGRTVYQVRSVQAYPTEAVKHAEPTAGIQAIDWASLGGAIAGEAFKAVNEVEKAKIAAKTKLLDNGTEILAIGFDTPDQQAHLREVIEASTKLVEKTSLQKAVEGPKGP